MVKPLATIVLVLTLIVMGGTIWRLIVENWHNPMLLTCLPLQVVLAFIQVLILFR